MDVCKMRRDTKLVLWSFVPVEPSPRGGDGAAEGWVWANPPESSGGPGRWSLGFHHELFQRLLPLIPAKQKNFFDFFLLEAHIVKLS